MDQNALILVVMILATGCCESCYCPQRQRREDISDGLSSDAVLLTVEHNQCNQPFTQEHASAIAGAASSIVRVPTEVVKQRMQTGQFTTAPNAVRMIVSREGFRGLYAGYGSFLLRDLPFDAIQFCIYEQIRLGYKLAARREPNDPENAIIGAFAGAITGAVTTPFDVIKTRLMVQGSTKQYKGIYDCVRTIVREEGSHVFLKGTGARVLWIGIGGAIFFGVLEKTKQVLSQEKTRI